jgi:hypothetical protein
MLVIWAAVDGGCGYSAADQPLAGISGGLVSPVGLRWMGRLRSGLPE